MSRMLYTVMMDGEPIAKHIPQLEYALVIIGALAEKYWAEAMETGMTFALVVEKEEHRDG